MFSSRARKSVTIPAMSLNSPPNSASRDDGLLTRSRPLTLRYTALRFTRSPTTAGSTTVVAWRALRQEPAAGTGHRRQVGSRRRNLPAQLPNHYRARAGTTSALQLGYWLHDDGQT